MGVRPKNIKGFKVGMYIGNSDYKFHDLAGAKTDAERMKSTMEGHNYVSFPIQENKTAGEIDTLFSTGVKNPLADALLLYYAGHGSKQGLLGVDDQIEAYSQVVEHLEAGVANGLHTTLIVDACEAGAGTDLFRAKAIERLPEKGSLRSQAVTEQIARLEDLKRHLSLPVILGLDDYAALPTQTSTTGSQESDGAPQDTRSITVSVNENTDPAKNISAPDKVVNQFWQKVVRPELLGVAAYLKEAGLGLEVPEMLSTYTVESIQQQINLFINKLIELAEIIRQEEEEPSLEKAGA